MSRKCVKTLIMLILGALDNTSPTAHRAQRVSSRNVIPNPASSSMASAPATSTYNPTTGVMDSITINTRIPPPTTSPPPAPASGSDEEDSDDEIFRHRLHLRRCMKCRKKKKACSRPEGGAKCKWCAKNDFDCILEPVKKPGKGRKLPKYGAYKKTKEERASLKNKKILKAAKGRKTIQQEKEDSEWEDVEEKDLGEEDEEVEDDEEGEEDDKENKENEEEEVDGGVDGGFDCKADQEADQESSASDTTIPFSRR